MENRDNILAILRRQKKAVTKTIEYYNSVANKLSSNEEWRIMKKSPLFVKSFDIKRIITANRKITDLLQIISETLDEYISSIEKFSDNQLAAFYMGLGLKSIPIEYWGIYENKKFISELNEIQGYYESLERDLGAGELWRSLKKVTIRMSP